MKERYRINERIRVREARLVGDNIGTGAYPIAQALKIAEEQGMDLVEISSNAVSPAYRVIDYQRFLYQQKKCQRGQKAKSVKVVVKEIHLELQTDDHNYNFKLKHAKGSSEEGSKAEAYMLSKGCSILFKEQGEILLLRFANDLEDYEKVEQLLVLEGKRMTIMLTPKKAGAGLVPAMAAVPKVVKRVIAAPKLKSEDDKKTEEQNPSLIERRLSLITKIQLENA